MNNLLIIIILCIIILLFIFKEFFNTTLLNIIVVLRGILAPNCFWYKISDLLLTDGAGVNLYNTYKKKYGDFIPSYMFGSKIYIVSNIKYIKIILNNSPNLFSVGLLKKKFFKSFMSKNVGVSSGCPWKKRRYMNEMALNTDKLHIYAEKYNADIIEQILQLKTKKLLEYEDFHNLGKIMVSKIVFNTNSLHNDIFKIFSEANTLKAFYFKDFKINTKIYRNYTKVLNHYIDKPNEKSLIELCVSVSHDKNEILHQIPHFIFPIVGLFVTTIPRLLVLLCNHKKVFNKVLQKINNINNYNSINDVKIYKLRLLRKCILETLRLNNPVITTFRTLDKDYTFDNKYTFKKGDQFLILNNPILREKEFFDEPNKFIPSRWTNEMENSYYAISFNQGPQRCPGKELAIYLAQIFIYNLIKIKNVRTTQDIVSKKININNIPQVINPCDITLNFQNLNVQN